MELLFKVPKICEKNFPMDHATMLAENQEREHQWRLQHVMQQAPPWPVRESSAVYFEFPHNGSMLLHDRKIVREIMDLSVKVTFNPSGVVYMSTSQESFDKQFKCLGVPLTFHEAFVSSHEQRDSLIGRVYEHYDTHWQRHIVDMSVKSFPTTAPGGFVPTLAMAVANWKTGVAQLYTMAQSTMARQIEAILQMQALVERLTRETRELVTRCADFGELDRSMLSAQTPALPTFRFKATAPVFGTPEALM